MIHVLAVITTRPGQRAAVLEEFNRNAVHVRAEQGCIEYTPVVDADDAPGFHTPLGPETFVVLEKWASLEALEAHSRAPHMAAYAAAVRERIDTRVIHVLSAAG